MEQAHLKQLRAAWHAVQAVQIGEAILYAISTCLMPHLDSGHHSHLVHLLQVLIQAGGT